MRLVAGVCFLLAAALGPAMAAECPGHPEALGTSRVLTINPGEFSRIGTMQYKESLPLNDHEVVITFDDGPLPPYSNIILDILASQCVKVTYFLVGEMARNYPTLVRRMYNEGHTIGTHSYDHPLIFQHLSLEGVTREVDGGIASVDAALGDPKALSPFFRIPGLGRSQTVEDYLTEKSLVTWSADVVADDWRHIGAKEIVKRAMRRLDEKGRGILLLHDIHPATVMALPSLLNELKDKGYHVVQVVAAGERPQSLPDLVASPIHEEAWPRVLKTSATAHVHVKAALRHRVNHHVKKTLTGKRHRRPAAVASLPASDHAASRAWQ